MAILEAWNLLECSKAWVNEIGLSSVGCKWLPLDPAWVDLAVREVNIINEDSNLWACNNCHG